jgi:hypothetical protein
MVVGFLAALAALVGGALWRELRRDDEQRAQSVFGVVEVASGLLASGAADIVRTDRVALFLLDPASGEPVALKFESPLVPPQNFQIGQPDALGGKPLSGEYDLIGITDKDGEVFRVTPGEVYGRGTVRVKLGMTQVRLVLDQPFRGSLSNSGQPAGGLAGGTADGGAGGMEGAGPNAAPEGGEDPRRTIAGVVRVAPALAGSVAPADRLVVLLFDPEAGRPVATKIVPHVLLPQRFSISLPPGAPVKAGYSLRILTDKNNSPFEPAPGEVVGRSAQPIPPGTRDVDFVLDQPYTR